MLACRAAIQCSREERYTGDPGGGIRNVDGGDDVAGIRKTNESRGGDGRRRIAAT